MKKVGKISIRIQDKTLKIRTENYLLDIWFLGWDLYKWENAVFKFPK